MENKSKFARAYFVIKTKEVNHTCLFNDAQKKGMLTDTFERMYYTQPYDVRKGRSNREHDEVIIRALPTLDLRCTFREVRTKKKTTRYVLIYKEYKTADEESVLEEIKSSLELFIRKYRRFPDRPKPVIKIVYHRDQMVL